MHRSKPFLAVRHWPGSLLLLGLSLTVAPAQVPSVGGRQAPEAKTSIVIDRQSVRFIAQGEAVEWRLVVSNQQGEVVFDSGLVSAATLAWPLLDAQGEPVAGGLYAYTLTIKEAQGETTRTQRGHVILDRASSDDRVWITSDSNSGIGADSAAAKLKVVGGGETTVGGTEFQAVAVRDEAGGEQGKEMKRAGAAKSTRETVTVSAATAGTANQVAKFAADGVSLIDSTVIETASGDIGIGTATPGGVLDLQRSSSGDILQRFWNTGGGGAKLRYVAATGATSQVQLTDNAEWLMAIADNNQIGMQFRVRGVGTANTEAQLNASARMAILRNGNVGIGTTTPSLINGGSGRLLSISDALNPGVALTNTGTGGNQYFLYSFTQGFAGGGSFRIYDATNGADRIILADNGNVGIGTLGTATPMSKLEIAAQDGLRISGYQPFLTLRDTNAGRNSYIQSVSGDLALIPHSFSGNGAAVVIKDVSGNVGIGTNSPSYKLHVEGGTDPAVHGFSSSSTGVSGSSSSGFGIYGVSGTNYAGYFQGNVYVTGTLTQNSDVRLKQGVTNLSYGLREVLQLRPVSWVWRDKPGPVNLGLIAQEVEPVIPELVVQGTDADQTLGLNYLGLVPVVIKAIQEQQQALDRRAAEVIALQTDNATLRRQNAAFAARLTALEQMVHKRATRRPTGRQRSGSAERAPHLELRGQLKAEHKLATP